MPLFIGQCTIKRDGRYYQPGAVHEMSEREAAALGPGVVRPAPVGVSAPAPATPATSAPVADFGDGAETETETDADVGDRGRIAEVKAAIDLLDADGFVKTGARAGKPKLKALADVLSFDPSDDEIDAAMELRSEGL